MSRKQLRSCYNRFFITFLLTMAVIQFSAMGISGVVRRCFPVLLTDPFWHPVLQVAVNDISCYLPPLILFPLMLTKLPEAEPLEKDPLSLPELAQALVVSMGVGYLFSFITVYIITVLEQLVGSTSQNFVNDFENSLPFWLTLFTFAVVAPFFEELIFRGILLNRLRGLGDVSAVLLSALAFGFFHLNVYQLAYAFVLGAIFACVALLTGSIRDTFLLHAIINGSSVLVDHYEVLENGFYLVVFISIPVGVWLFLRERKHIRFESGPLPFSSHEKYVACLRSPWFLITVVLCVLISVISVFL